MRVVSLCLLVACSHPAKRGESPVAPANDASVSVPIDAATTESSSPDADAIAAVKPLPKGVALFDWETHRKAQDEARARRMNIPRYKRCKPDPNEPNKDPCAHGAGPLAATARVGNRDTTADLLLDIGSEDGVTKMHWAAVIDDDGRRLTKFHRILDVGTDSARARVENAAFGQQPRVAVVSSPPRDERGE